MDAESGQNLERRRVTHDERRAHSFQDVGALGWVRDRQIHPGVIQGREAHRLQDLVPAIGQLDVAGMDLVIVIQP